MPHSEGLQLSRDLGATYLELPSLNHVFVGRYFGSVVCGDITQASKHLKHEFYNNRGARSVIADTLFFFLSWCGFKCICGL